MSGKNFIEQAYSVWEKRTSKLIDSALRNSQVLKASSEVMNQQFKSKIVMDQALMKTWRNLLLPNKKDQEKTLHLLNELHSRIFDLEERLEELGKKQQGQEELKSVKKASRLKKTGSKARGKVTTETPIEPSNKTKRKISKSTSSRL